MAKALLIVNPSSGGEKAKTHKEMVIKKLEELFDEVEITYTEKAGDATNFAKKAAKDGFDSVFAMGGDGTVNEAINGLAGEENPPKFGFFPLGTVNDLARALGIPLDLEEAVESLSLDRTRKIDIGKINEHYFMNVVAVGVIPEAVNQVTPEEKTKFGKLAYFISGFKQLGDNHSHTFHLELDGKKQTIESSTLIIGLTNSVGGFEQLLPEAEVDDNLLHLIYLKDKNFLQTVKAVPDLLKGISETNANVGYQTFTEGKISVAGEETVPTNVDGDEGEELPIHLTLLPAHLEVFC
ncbi:diacylglycerol/lipid kinase family protein [Enterococcus mediterraneensis]|uniref:diacylglycerol/lipid kinase family protein n=1 Tax=Enterococcus mediterraneensis TaxID=2364791 RepID=UPI000F04668E|nr:diacylglycerol kinase family protein [Enterococcus mediterraneensis]